MAGVKHNHCVRCLGYSAARREEAGRGRLGRAARPHYCQSDKCRCETAARRTSDTMSRVHAQVLQLRNLGMTTSGHVAERCAEFGVKVGVMNRLEEFSAFIPHDCGGIYAAFVSDLLHVVNIGVVPKFLRMLDALTCDRFSRSQDFRSREDVRNRTEERLQQIPTMVDGWHRMVTFKMGWS